MKIPNMIRSLFDSASDLHTLFAILGSMGIPGLKKLKSDKPEAKGAEDLVKDVAGVIAGGFGKGDELNFASMVSKMDDLERGYFILFLEELGEKDLLKLAMLVVHFGTKYESNSKSAIEEATEIARIRSKGSSPKDFENALLYCENACYTSDTNIMMVKGVSKKVSNLVKTLASKVDVDQINKELDSFEGSINNFLEKYNGKIDKKMKITK